MIYFKKRLNILLALTGRGKWKPSTDQRFGYLYDNLQRCRFKIKLDFKFKFNYYSFECEIFSVH